MLLSVLLQDRSQADKIWSWSRNTGLGLGLTTLVLFISSVRCRKSERIGERVVSYYFAFYRAPCIACNAV